MLVSISILATTITKFYNIGDAIPKEMFACESFIKRLYSHNALN